ncbi:MAG: ABC transporter substrate-binding protein [Reyranellaceae bacterium]
MHKAMRRGAALAATLLAATALALPAAAQKFADQGVSKDEIVIGTHQDLSGPIKAFGIPTANGMKMAVDEINANGGINGRKIKLVIEDSGYDPKRAVLATQKMIERDEVFAMVATLGSPTTLAPQDIVLDAGVFQLFPVTSAEFTWTMEKGRAQERLKFAITLPYADSIRATMKALIEEKKLSKPCVMYQDDEFGKNVTDGFEAQLKAMNLKAAAVTSYKRGASDFSSQIAKMKAENCDLVVLGTIIRETIGAMAEAKRLQWNPVFLGSAAANVVEVPLLGKEAVEGFYAAGLFEMPYADTVKGKVKDWFESYKKQYGAEPTTQVIYGYNGVMTFAHYAQLAGKDLNGKTMLEALESGKGYENIFGTAPIKFSKENHLMSIPTQLQQVQNGKWVLLKENLSF